MIRYIKEITAINNNLYFDQESILEPTSVAPFIIS
jgi:hypothetical protein